MIAKTKDMLVEAATGKKPPQPPVAIQNPMTQAMQSKLMPAPTYGEFMTQAGLTSPPVSSTMGLSSEGKYGGFYTASDLDKAIRGEAMTRNEELLDYASSLRELAQKQRGQVGQTVGQQLRMAQGAENFMGPIGPRANAAEQAVQEYGTRRMAELEKGDVLAANIEATPASQLAQAIATRKYGVNPALAAGMYGTDYDIETAKALRDQYYYESGQGYGYQDYLSEMAREQARQDQERQDIAAAITRAKQTQSPEDIQAAYGYSQEVRDLDYTNAVSDALGMNAARLFSAAQVTPKQGYDLISQNFNLPEALGGGQANFTGLVNEAMKNINSDNEAAAFQTADALIADPNTRMLGRLLATYVDALVRSVGKTGRGLYQYQQTSDILGP